MPTVLIVGAGLTGLSAAHAARARGWTPLLVEKSRGVGGRLATRWMSDRAAVFDTGAQFFSVRDPMFAAAVQQWASAGVATIWSHGFPVLSASGLRDETDGHPRWRIAGGMTRLAKHLASGLVIRDQRTVTRLERSGAGWRVELTPGDTVRGAAQGPAEHEQVDAVVLTQPVPQQIALLQASGLAPKEPWASRLAAVRYDSCLGLLLEDPAATAPWLPEPGGVRVDDPSLPVLWLASQRRKGLRVTGEGLIVHFRADISAANRTLDEAAQVALLRRAVEPLFARLGMPSPLAAAAQVKSWRYSLAAVTIDDPCCVLEPGLILAGDAFGGRPRVEGAWLSGQAAAVVL